MILGTMSSVGKSFITAGLLRVFKEKGLKAVPFKAQNMALNSFVTDEGREMGRAQAMQAEAAGVRPEVSMNPILLKPSGDMRSQVIVMGKSIGEMRASEYFREKSRFIPIITDAFNKLDRENDVIIIEGAGSPVEINLNKDDFVNIGMAALAKAPALLVGDIERGGVFAQLVGTLNLLKPGEKEYVKGIVINKFRGDISLLDDGLRQLENLTERPVLGVVPFRDFTLDDEDSLSGMLQNKGMLPGESLIDIAVIRLPRISNFTDFNPFEMMEGVSLRFVSRVGEIGDPDLLILPGTKNTLGDLRWLKSNGIFEAVKEFAASGVVFGICGGFQMLGESIRDPEGLEGGGEEEGLSLLPVNTVFSKEKELRQVAGEIEGVEGIFSCLNRVSYEGYEIHQGRTEGGQLLPEILSKGNIYGTYIHGLFDRKEAAGGIIGALLQRKGIDRSIEAFDISEIKEKEYSRMAALLRESLDMERIESIMEEGIK